MAKVPMTREIKRLHKKFVPGNIVFCILAVIACLAQLFIPFFDLRIHIHGEKLVPVIESALQESSSSSSPYARTAASSSSSADSSGEDTMMKAITDAVNEIDFEIPVNIYPMTMLKAATGTEEDIATFMNSIIGKNGVAEFANELVNALAKPMLKASINVMVDDALANADLTEEERAKVEEYRDEINDVVDAFMDAKGEEELEAAKDKMIDTIQNIAQTEGGESLSDEDIEQIEKVLDELIEQGKDEEGNFDVMELLKNLDFDALMGEEGEETESGDSSIAPAAFIMTASSSSSSSSEDEDSSSGNAFAEIIEMIENPGQLIVDAMEEAGLKTEDMQTFLLIAFLLMAGIQAFFWAVFALSALLHIFTKKKNIRTRYVRLFCVWCGLGVWIGNLGVSLLPTVLTKVGGAEAAGMVTTMLSAFEIKFLGAGVITGACWVVMFFFNLIYYRPIRKKIKRETKRLKKMIRRGESIDDEMEEFDVDEVRPA